MSFKSGVTKLFVSWRRWRDRVRSRRFERSRSPWSVLFGEIERALNRQFRRGPSVEVVYVHPVAYQYFVSTVPGEGPPEGTLAWYTDYGSCWVREDPGLSPFDWRLETQDG